MQTTNKVILIGHLGADPEGFLTKKSVQGARLRIATNATWKGEDGEDRSITDWHRIVDMNDCESCHVPGISFSGALMDHSRANSEPYL